MKEIKLSKGYITLVDDEDYERLTAFKWHAHVGKGGLVYAVRSLYNRKIWMHRQVLKLTSSMGEVDHLDHNSLNNQKSNLRVGTHADNLQNSKRSRVGNVRRSRITKTWLLDRLLP